MKLPKSAIIVSVSAPKLEKVYYDALQGLASNLIEDLDGSRPRGHETIKAGESLEWFSDVREDFESIREYIYVNFPWFDEAEQAISHIVEQLGPDTIITF